MAEIKWIKITVDMFCNRKIRHLRRLPEGDRIVLIWVMLLTMAGRCNAGGFIYLTESIPYTPKMLADELDFDENTVVLALNALEAFGMIVRQDNTLAISGWEEYQNTEKMQEIREQNRLRKQKQRERQLNCEQKQAICEQSHVTSRDCHVTVTLQNKKEDTDLRNNTILSGKPDGFSENCREIVEYLNRKTGKNFKYSTDATQTKIRARIREGFTKEDFFAVIDNRCAEWKTDEVMSVYLRPETLFGTKFESYLQAAKTSAAGGGMWKREEQDDLSWMN